MQNVRLPTLVGTTALALLIGATTPVVADEITIKRDNYGTPHIFADDRYGLFFGYGYSIAQDRLYQLEITRRSTQGKVAEVLGSDYLDFDIGIRKHYDPASIHAQLESLPDEQHDILQGYADGINRWLEAIEANPETLMPKQFIDAGFEPSPWSSFDVAMIFIGTMVNRFGDYNTELENQQIFMNLVEMHGEEKGQALFDLLLTFYDPAAPTTIPHGDWDPQLRDGAFSLDDKNSKSITFFQAPENETYLAASGGTLQLPNLYERPFSNLLILGSDRSDSAESILINGPQFGFYQPAYTYSVGLHGAGYNAVGNSPFGYPMIMFGHNDSITWGSTWGAADNVDLFRLELDPSEPERYLVGDDYHDLDSRVETINVRDQKSHELTVYRSHHGAVVDYRPDEGVAYAKARGWEGHEMATLMAWHNITNANNHAEWLEEASKSAINVNLYYADKEGNIAYVMGGRYPQRAPGHDGRLPAPGYGNYDWPGFMPFETNPQVINPSTGYIANWNQRAAEGMPNPDMWWYAWHEADRVQTLFDSIEEQESFSGQEAWELMMEASFIDPSARFFIPRLVEAVEAADAPELLDAIKLLATWDHREIDQTGDGYYDSPAVPLYRAWLMHLIEQIYSNILPEAHNAWFLNTGHLEPGGSSPGSTNISVAAKVLYHALQGESDTIGFDIFGGKDPKVLMRNALTESVESLKEEQGDEMSAWRTAVTHTTFSHLNFLRVPQAGEEEAIQIHHAMNRGTENNMTIFSNGQVSGYEVAAPGQSGFIAPDGNASPHYQDQLNLFETLDNKRMWLTPDDIKSNTSHSETIEY